MRKMINGRERAAFIPFEMFPLKGDPLPPGKSGWLLLLDEFNSAPKMVQAAAYKLALDEMVGQEHLHENCLVVCAGNLDTDNAIVNRLSTAMQSRLVHIHLENSPTDFMDLMLQKNWDHRLIGYHTFKPEAQTNFNPDHQDSTFACNRTWEFVNKYISGKALPEIDQCALAGMVSDGPALDFYAYLEHYANLPTIKIIKADPLNVPVPNEAATCYAMLTTLMSQFDIKDFPDVVKYVQRFPAEMRVMYFRFVDKRHPNMRRDRVFADNLQQLTRFLTSTV